MSRNERRAAIIEAAVKLLESDGPDFTTRRVAEAAGVAEGTLFRVFPTLADLLAATYEEYLSPRHLHELLDAVDLGDDLEAATAAAVRTVFAYLASVHLAIHPVAGKAEQQSAPTRVAFESYRQRIVDLETWLNQALGRYADELAFPVASYARFLMTLSIGHFMRRQTTDSVPDITRFALDGARRRTRQ